MNSANENPTDGAAKTVLTGVNTYSTGGGGVTFAHRVAVTYLASMLTGSRRSETNDLPVTSLAFQTGPAHPVDDLLVVAGNRALAVACRATPRFVPSDAPTVKLVRSLLDEVATHPNGHVAVAVAGWKTEWEQVAKLCDIARTISNAHDFHTASEIDGRWSKPVRERYTHLLKMVSPNGRTFTDVEVLELTWGLLRRLRIVGFKLQSPDEADWAAVATSLDGIAAATTDGVGLRDRLAATAGRYDALGAVVDMHMLRTDTHHVHVRTAAQTHSEVLTREAYLDRIEATSRSRLEARRAGAGLSPGQIARSLTHPVSVPEALHALAAGALRVLTGPLGSGKSDIAEEWLRASLAKARQDLSAPVPVWAAVRDLDQPLGEHIATEVGSDTLARTGVDVVVDGLDERTDRAATALRQATDFVVRWPKSRILLTSRAPEKVNENLLVEIPSLRREQADRLMTLVAGRPITGLGHDLEEAIERPFFALLVARHATAAEGATSTQELIDLVVEDVVTAEGFDLYNGLRSSAAETIRSGKPVDPNRFTTADIAAQIRTSSLVTGTGKTCAFSLAIFEQWFAAKAVLEGEVPIDDLLTSLRSFDRWKYVFAMVFAAGEPNRVDPVMSSIARWNPGAASWVIKETRRGRVSSSRPVADTDDWEEIGQRLRYATAAWLHGLGPLADAFYPYAATGSRNLDAVTVAVDSEHTRLHVAWIVPDLAAEPLPPVISARSLPEDRAFVSRTHAIPTGLNWVWETARDHLADDLTKSFLTLAQHVGAEHSEVIHNEACEAARHRYAPFPWLTDEPDPDRGAAPLYPQADIPPSPTMQWGAFTEDAMHERVQEIIAAAMSCYIDLVSVVTPQFGDTLGHRGHMPVEFYGDVSYDPHRERGAFEYFGPREPGIRWLLRPIGNPAPDGRRQGQNTVSLTMNDDQRSDEIHDDRNSLYGSFRAYVEAYPAYEPFAHSFSTHSGRFGMLEDKPATKIALSWLWKDLQDLGWIKDHFPAHL